MLQRRQTLYVFLGLICQFANCFIQDFNISDWNFIIHISLLLIACIAIMSYNKRRRQIYYITFLQLFAWIYIIIYLYQISFENERFFQSIGLLLISIIFYYFAKKNIKKDDELIKSIDRLR